MALSLGEGQARIGRSAQWRVESHHGKGTVRVIHEMTTDEVAVVPDSLDVARVRVEEQTRSFKCARRDDESVGFDEDGAFGCSGFEVRNVRAALRRDELKRSTIKQAAKLAGVGEVEEGLLPAEGRCTVFEKFGKKDGAIELDISERMLDGGGHAVGLESGELLMAEETRRFNIKRIKVTATDGPAGITEPRALLEINVFQRSADAVPSIAGSSELNAAGDRHSEWTASVFCDHGSDAIGRDFRGISRFDEKDVFSPESELVSRRGAPHA
jgi:hypothetical protein